MIRSKVTETQLRRVCKMYSKNIEAARALGISQPWFHILCERYGIARPVAGKRPPKKIPSND